MATESPITVAEDKKWFKGADVTLRWTLSTGDDMTGWTVKFAMARTIGATAALTKTCSVDVPNKQVYTVIADTDTETLDPGVYFYGVWRTDTDHEVPLAYGTAELEPVQTIPTS